MSRSSDRNLLFGILAQQMDFLASDRLAGGLQAWLQDKQRPIGEVLVERGLMTVQHQTLLEPLVDAHIEQHGGDAGQSLAALSSDGGLLESLKSVEDDELQESLSLLPQPDPELLPDAGAQSTALPPEADDSHLPTMDESEQSASAGASGAHGNGARPAQRFRIIRPHAEGGLGRVFVAVDQELNREVAFKDIKPQHARRQDAQSRFMVEAEVTGGLEHPGIVPVYGLGHFPDGRPFYAMRFVRGQSLHDAIREFHRSSRSAESASSVEPDSLSDTRAGVDFTSRAFRDLINRLIDVCNAMQYAHDRKVLHRDLKPGNIMLGKYGETLVVDWGLAKATGVDAPKERSAETEQPIIPASGSQSAPTMAGSTIGTPAYMPPEQAEGRINELGPASDAYSLGATLYEILTGERPLKSSKLPELLERVREGDIPPPRSLSHDIPAALNAVCVKAMATRPDDRYESAKALADDLEAWLADEPVAAYPEPLVLRARRWIRRHPALVSATAAGVLMALVGLSVLSTVVTSKNQALTESNARATAGEALANRNAATAELQRNAAEAARAQADIEREKVSEQLSLSRITRVEAELNDGHRTEAMALLNSIPIPHRHWEAGYLARKLDGTQLRCNGHTGGISCVGFSPDGTQIVSASDNFTDTTAIVWNAATGETIATLQGHSAGINCACFSPDSNNVVTGSSDSSAIIWDATSGQLLLTLEGHSDSVNSADYSPDGERIVTGSIDNTAVVWNAVTGEKLLTFQGHSAEINGATFSPSGEHIATCSDDTTAIVWDASSGQELLTLEGHSRDVRCVKFSPDGKRIATGSNDDTAIIWDASSGQKLLTIQGKSDDVHTMSFSPDGRWVVLGSSGDTFAVFDAFDGSERFAIPGPRELRLGQPGDNVTFSPDGTRLVDGCEDGEVRVWNLTDSGDSFSIRNVEPTSVCFSPDGLRLAGGLRGGTVREWNPVTGDELQQFNGHSDVVSSVAYNSDGTKLVSGSYDKSIRIWNTTTGKTIGTLVGHSDKITAVSMSPDGKRIISGGHDHTVRVWDTVSGNESFTFDMKSDVLAVDFSNDGTRFAASGGKAGGGELKLWDALTGEKLLDVESLLAPVYGIAFSPDGKSVVGGSLDAVVTGVGEVKVWDVASGEVSLFLRGHSKPVKSVAFSSCGKRILSGSVDAIKIWDASSGALAITLHGPGNPTSVRFSPDGRWVVVGAAFLTIDFEDPVLGDKVDGGEIRFWDSATTTESLTLPQNPHQVGAAAVSSDGSRVVSGNGKSGPLRVWDAYSGRELQSLHGGHTNFIGDVRFSLKGDRIFSECWDGKGVVWDVATGSTLDQPPPPSASEDSGNIHSLDLSGNYLTVVHRNPDYNPWQEDVARRAVQLPSWHENSAAESEKDRNWFAALFHLRRLSKLKPDDATIRKRIANAEAFLAESP